MNINEILTDEEIEDCIDGSSNIQLLRSIIELTQQETLVDVGSFGDVFAYEIRGFIDADPETEEWDRANDINREWGETIAENINDLITSKFTD